MNAIIWNPEKIAMAYKGTFEYASFEALRDLEKVSRCSYSSLIEVNDQKQLEEFIDAVINESDTTLEYKIVKTHGFYVSSNYRNASEAEKDGALHSIFLPNNWSEDMIWKFAEFISNEVMGSCIGDIGYECR